MPLPITEERMDAASAVAETRNPKFDPFQVPGVIGVELARHSAAIDHVLQAFRKTRSITRSQMETLRQSTASIHRIALISQQLSRLAAGRLRQSHERVGLDALIGQVLKDNDYRYYEQGVVFEQRLQPVEVILDPGLLMSLLEMAFDCAARHGQVIAVFLKIKNWPEHGLLTLRCRQHVSTADPQAAVEEPLEWVMLLQLAEATGVIVQRETVND